jgi:hypothetical protein
MFKRSRLTLREDSDPTDSDPLPSSEDEDYLNELRRIKQAERKLD